MMQPHEMTFAEFVEATHPSGGMNRYAHLGGSKDGQAYNVFLSGEAAEKLPKSLRAQEFRDVTLEALTEKLGLNPGSFRDNVRVAEIVAVRHAYMANVLEASCIDRLSPVVQQEYGLLDDFLKHPVIREQVAAQLALSSALTPAMAAARAKLGPDITERAAAGASRGTIVARNDQFTVQDIGGGQVVAHENKRLLGQAQEGDEVTVSYYKGKGQVIVERGQEISEPFVDAVSGDMAVLLTNAKSSAGVQMVLFNSLGTVAEFADAHNLTKDFVRQAMKARDASPPKDVAQEAVRTPVGAPFIDDETGNIALQYKEGARTFTAVFHSANAFAMNAHEFNATPAHVQQAKTVEREAGPRDPVREDIRMLKTLVKAGSDMEQPNVERGRYAGPVIATSRLHVLQDAGRDTVIVHDKRDLDKVPQLNARMTVAYKEGRGAVDVRAAERGGRA